MLFVVNSQAVGARIQSKSQSKWIKQMFDVSTWLKRYSHNLSCWATKWMDFVHEMQTPSRRQFSLHCPTFDVTGKEFAHPWFCDQEPSSLDEHGHNYLISAYQVHHGTRWLEMWSGERGTCSICEINVEFFTKCFSLTWTLLCTI